MNSENSLTWMHDIEKIHSSVSWIVISIPLLHSASQHCHSPHPSLHFALSSILCPSILTSLYLLQPYPSHIAPILIPAHHFVRSNNTPHTHTHNPLPSIRATDVLSPLIINHEELHGVHPKTSAVRMEEKDTSLLTILSAVPSNTSLRLLDSSQSAGAGTLIPLANRGPRPLPKGGCDSRAC